MRVTACARRVCSVAGIQDQDEDDERGEPLYGLNDLGVSFERGAIGSPRPLVERNPKTGKKRETQIFPRYHQLDCVRHLVSDALSHGAGQRYLIEHSAGSGKSNTIAWLAHQDRDGDEQDKETTLKNPSA